jgi:hypothetical protein
MDLYGTTAMESDLGITHKNLLSLAKNNKDEKWGRQNDSAAK